MLSVDSRTVSPSCSKHLPVIGPVPVLASRSAVVTWRRRGRTGRRLDVSVCRRHVRPGTIVDSSMGGSVESKERTKIWDGYVRNIGSSDDERNVSQRGRLDRVATDALVDDIDRAIPELYAYVLRRCGGRALAEDLTSESILAAVDHINAGSLVSVDVGYLIGIARHKLVDHWRRGEREHRHLLAFVGGRTDAPTDDHFEPGRASAVLSDLNPMQRAALTLRYFDDLPVGDVARLLGRSVHATETLLVARSAPFVSAMRRSRRDCRHDRPVRCAPPIG